MERLRQRVMSSLDSPCWVCRCTESLVGSWQGMWTRAMRHKAWLAWRSPPVEPVTVGPPEEAGSRATPQPSQGGLAAQPPGLSPAVPAAARRCPGHAGPGHSAGAAGLTSLVSSTSRASSSPAGTASAGPGPPGPPWWPTQDRAGSWSQGQAGAGQRLVVWDLGSWLGNASGGGIDTVAQLAAGGDPRRHRARRATHAELGHRPQRSAQLTRAT